MCRLLCAAPSASSSTLMGPRHEGPGEVLVSVLVFGDDELMFIVGTRDGEAREDTFIYFPCRRTGSTECSGAPGGGDARALVRELQRAAGVHDNQERREKDECGRCGKPHCSIAALSCLRVEGLQVILFFVLECDCFLLASFTVGKATLGAQGTNEAALRFGDGETASVTAVRWFTCDSNESVEYARARRQHFVPINALASSVNSTDVLGLAVTSNATATVHSQSFVPPPSLHTHKPIRMVSREGCGTLREQIWNTSVLRVAFVRVVGWVEYVEICWRSTITADASDSESSLWRELSGFDSLSVGALPLQVDDAVGVSGSFEGEVRTLHWMPYSYDYRQHHPLLAVLHQRASVVGDPLVDCLSICALVTSRQRRQNMQFCAGEDVSWVASYEKECGACVSGPWRVDVLTLAHPSFLLHTCDNAALLSRSNRTCYRSAGHVGDVLGVFLRPSHVMYPRSGILRRETAYKTWEPSAQRSLAAGEEVESFYFALFSECGEVARCPVGGFIESAVSFFVEQDEERRLSSATANFQRVLAVVLAVQSGGAFVFLEVLSSTAFSEGKPRVTGVCNPGERSVTISVVARTVTVSMPQELRSFQHLHCLASMRWSGSKGSALLLAAHVEDNHVPEGKTGGKEAGDLCCSLISIEMLRGKGGVHIRTWQTNTGESGYGGGKSGFPFHSGMPMLLEPTGINSVEYSVGAVRHAPLEPLCRCEAPALNVDHYLNASGARNSKDMEIVLFRSGDICLCRRAFLDGVHASAAGGTEEDCVKYQWLSTVQWPSFAEPEAVNALTILFSSASHNVCMIAMPCSKGRDSVPREGKCGVVNLKDEVLLLVTCRSTVIVMSVSGRVLWASDLCEDAVKEAAKVSGSGALEIPSLICCMLRPLASWAESFFAVLSATVASPPHVGGVDGACLQCVFLLLQVRWWPKGTADDCRPVASVCVTDTHHAAAYGQLIFDLAPLPCFECGVARLPSNVTMEETTMCSAELLYCSGCLLSSIACAVLFVTSGSGISLVARFFQLRGGGENLLDFRCVIDDEGRRNNTELFTQPTLLKFVGLPSDRRYSGILFISFLSGLTLVAGLYSHSGHGNRQWALQLLKTPAVAVAASGEVAPAPFVQLLQNVKSSNDEDSLCFVQDACGRWAVLHCERVRKKSHECWEAELGQEMLLQLDGLVDNLQRALHGGDEVVILSHGASGSFALVPG